MSWIVLTFAEEDALVLFVATVGGDASLRL